MSEDKNELTLDKTVRDLSAEELKKLGINKITIGASADSKVTIRQFETMGVFASTSIEVDLSAFTGSLDFVEIFNGIVVPVRNSLTAFVHTETMARAAEMRALVEGIRDNLSYADIERNMREARNNNVDIMKATFEPKKKTS